MEPAVQYQYAFIGIYPGLKRIIQEKKNFPFYFFKWFNISNFAL